MKRNNIQRAVGALVVAAALSACGGGGGGGGSGFYPFPIGGGGGGGGGSEPPQSQADPYDQFVAYVQSVVAQLLDTEEPANVAAFDPPPTSETRDPVGTP